MQTSQRHSEIGYVSKIVDSVKIIGSEDPKLEALLEEHDGPTIGTHSGTFHCDEVLACTMLLYTDHFKAPLIVRSRDNEVLAKLDLIADVGGEYIPEKLRFDHHQKSFTEVWNKDEKRYEGIKLSSAGLVYRHYGKEVMANVLSGVWGLELSEEALQKVYLKMYNKLILEIDAKDNGVDVAETMRYSVSSHLGSRVGRMNLDWDAPDTACVHKQFRKAMLIAEEELMYNVKQIQSQLSAFSIVEGDFNKRQQVHPSGEIMVLSKFCPWKGLLCECEDKNNETGKVKFVLFQDFGGSWRISTVSTDAGSFAFRVSIKKAWCGLRDNDLSEAAGITDGVFVHMSGFIGGAKSYESVLKMAEASIQAHNEDKALAQ